MDRRGFLKRLGVGATAAAVSVAMPASATMIKAATGLPPALLKQELEEKGAKTRRGPVVIDHRSQTVYVEDRGDGSATDFGMGRQYITIRIKGEDPVTGAGIG